MKSELVLAVVAWSLAGGFTAMCHAADRAAQNSQPLCISGRYPHLAMFNRQGECGTGAVVPWADRLWVITYAPHKPEGSDDKLYEIDPNLNRVTRPESVGGTPAGRMIHRESNQLVIGPYLIDAKRNVRAIPPEKMFARITAVARHLTDPENKVYFFDMEGLVYEADVRTLDVNLLFKRAVPGWHGKGAYTAQGRFVVANNGEHGAASVNKFKPFDYQLPVETGGENAGALAEWDGKTWKLVERRQFTEVTGPGGVNGAPSDDAQLWSVGWDKRSVILKLLDAGQWHTFRLPKADYSYDGAHGWHTEWPRIREVTGGKLLMNMHGGWYDFPRTFSAARTGGLRPIASYLKITADFCGWLDRIVFGCDDTALSGFSGEKMSYNTMNSLNGQSNSGLWFTRWDDLFAAGRPSGFGGVWMDDDVKAGALSTPYLFGGYDRRALHLSHKSPEPVTFAVEIDKTGNGKWSVYQNIAVPARGYLCHIFPPDVDGQWVRLKTDRDAAQVTAYFHYGPGGGATEDRKVFAALADIGTSGPWSGAIVRSEGDDRITLAVMARPVDASGKAGEPRFYQVGADMKFQPAASDSKSAVFLKEKAAITNQVIETDEASVILTEGKARYRLPKSDDGYDKEWPTGWPRAVREVVTERTLINAAGAFYVMPRVISGGAAHLKPICAHNKRITDFCSWRGLIVIAGTRADAKPDSHYFAAADGGIGLWFGDIDDLWKLGKPRGVGGPWKGATVKAGEPSDPYLMTGYDKKTLELSHDALGDVTFTVEVDVDCGNWHRYEAIVVPAGRTVTHEFPAGFNAHWARLTADRECKATAWFVYE